MLTEELARRFGAKLREIEPLDSQQLPLAISDLLRAIAQAEQPPRGEADKSSSGLRKRRANNRCGRFKCRTAFTSSSR
jgi:hypothetical protein